MAQADDYSHYPVETRPAPTDVVWCLVPFINKNGVSEVKERPGLVRAVEFYAYRTRVRVHVSYGTSNLKLDMRQWDLFITDPEELAYAGLRLETRFDLDRRQEKQRPWAEEFFPTPEGYETPVIGRLHRNALRRLHVLTG